MGHDFFVHKFHKGNAEIIKVRISNVTYGILFRTNILTTCKKILHYDPKPRVFKPDII